MLTVWPPSSETYAVPQPIYLIAFHLDNTRPYSSMPCMRDIEVLIRKLTSFLLTRCTETKNTWHRPDPSFTYLLSFFLLLTALAWGVAYTPSFGAIVRLSLLFVFVHFIGSSLLISTIAYFLVGRIFGPNGAAASLTGLRGTRGRRRGAATGLFMQPGEKEQVEFGYCFDVSEAYYNVPQSVPLSPNA